MFILYHVLCSVFPKILYWDEDRDCSHCCVVNCKLIGNLPRQKWRKPDVQSRAALSECPQLLPCTRHSFHFLRGGREGQGRTEESLNVKNVEIYRMFRGHAGEWHDKDSVCLCCPHRAPLCPQLWWPGGQHCSGHSCSQRSPGICYPQPIVPVGMTGACHSHTLLSWTGDTKSAEFGTRKGQGEVTWQLLSWEKHTQLEEMSLIY